MRHDQLFKRVMEKFFGDFLELFFPAVAQRLDFGTLAFLDKELFVDLPQGPRREVDVVGRFETHEGEPEFVLVHVEVQSRPEKDFARRMFEYSVLLWLRHRAPIFPVVLYLQGGEGVTDEEYQLALFGREVFRFRYASVGLAHLWAEEYVDTGPLGSALAVLMRQRKHAEPVLLEAGLMRRVGERFDPLRKFLLINIIETYSRLSAEERARLERLLSRKEYRSVLEVKETWSERMRNEGIVEGKRETLKRLLAEKFGPLSPEVTAKVEAMSSGEQLDRYLDRILKAGSLEDIGL